MAGPSDIILKRPESEDPFYFSLILSAPPTVTLLVQRPHCSRSKSTMSSLTARHRWCAERILFCFVHNDKENNERFDESKVQSFLRKPKIQEKFDDLFAGEGPAALFVHYQPRHVNELDPLDPTESCDGKLTKKSELFISNGDSTLMNSKCCYFLRQGYQVDSSVANDTSLLYGEFLDSPLETIKTMLSSTYAPLFAQSSEWGETNEEQKADFNDEMNKFMRNLTSAVESISGGLELRGLTSTPIESLNSPKLTMLNCLGCQEYSNCRSKRPYSISASQHKLLYYSYCPGVAPSMPPGGKSPAQPSFTTGCFSSTKA